MRLCIDFDETLFLNEWPGVGPVVPGAAEHVQRLKADGHTIIIWSARASHEFPDQPADRARGLQQMKDALDNHGIPYDAIDYGDQGKLRADLYIDDHGLGVPLVPFAGVQVLDWPKAYQMIRLVLVARRLGAHVK